MRMILQTEECGGLARYLPVRRLDGETRLKAEKRFLNCRVRGIILGCSFEDDVWTLTNELRRYTLDFRFDGTAFRRKAEAWIGCSEECYRECMKAYAAFHLGTYTLNYLQEIVGEMRLVAGMDKDEAEMLSGNERAPMFPMTGFLSLIPESNDLRDLVIEAWEEQKWRVRVSNPRPLADFALYLRFNKELDRFWDAASPEEKRFYFPVYFWWKLTVILPLRVTEFLVTPRNCLSKEGVKFLLSIRRTKLKKGGRRISYTVDSDYRIQWYEIPEWLFQEIGRYREATSDVPLPALGTLLVPDYPAPCGYFSYVQLSRRLKRFCAEILNDKAYPIHAGDTRHLAMISLILSGGSPVICRELAGHESVDISAHYYSNLSTIIESAVYEHYHGWTSDSLLTGFLRFPTTLPSERIRVNRGWCDVPAVERGDISECLKCYDRSGRIGDCANCTHFYPDSPGLRLELERSRKKAVDEDGEYLMRMIELVRKGLGLQEDIEAALLRLQNSGYRYGALLSEKRLREDWNGKA